MKQAFINYALGLAVCGLATYYAIRFMGPNAVVVVALWGALLAKPLLESILYVYSRLKNTPLKPYQGRYYAFNYHHIRVYEMNHKLWVVDADVLPIINLQVSDAAKHCAKSNEYRYLEHEKVWVYAESYLMALIQNSHHPNAASLTRWLNRAVYVPYRNKNRYNTQ
jgi:hypothetical protein